MIAPFTLPYSEPAVEDLRQRLARTRWPDTIPGSGWDYGFELEEMQRICRYWQERFDWKAQLAAMARFRHFRCAVDGVGIHFIHERGRGSNPIPLLLVHGWPGSFLEMMKIIPLLTDPAAHGGDLRDSFDVIVPSLPGFGYSDKPAKRGMNTLRMAELFAGLMSELGYKRFATQGGDFGSEIVSILGLRYAEHMIGVHLNAIESSYRPWVKPGTKLAKEEEEFLRYAVRWREDSGAYSHVQGNTPLTAAYGLNDSPAALAGWILEKFRSWADCADRLENSFTLDELLTNVTLYWMTETIHSSCRLYYECKRAPFYLQEGERVSVPCGVAFFPKEDPFPPRAWAERGYNIVRWSEMPHGGHFAAMEEPELLAEDIRVFFKSMR